MSKPREGTWQVTTASGSDYILDLDKMTMVRYPDSEANVLRKDAQHVPLLEVITLELGVMMELMIDVRGDGVETYRRTTAVETLEPISDSERFYEEDEDPAEILAAFDAGEKGVTGHDD